MQLKCKPFLTFLFSASREKGIFVVLVLQKIDARLFYKTAQKLQFLSSNKILEIAETFVLFVSTWNRQNRNNILVLLEWIFLYEYNFCFQFENWKKSRICLSFASHLLGHDIHWFIQLLNARLLFRVRKMMNNWFYSPVTGSELWNQARKNLKKRKMIKGN